MLKITRVGDRVSCPKCRGEARVVWVSNDGEVAAIKCMRYHGHIGSSTKASRDFKTKTKLAKGTIFLIKTT